MSLILHPDIVRYSCTCGTLNPISRIYFCRHCLEVRCGYCVSHEIDSNYCANCLENLPSLEARLKKNRCATCYDCPSCSHTLSVRATSVSTPNADDPSKSTLQKFYYLACALCRWTSRDAGIPDQKKPTGGWPKAENPNLARFVALMEYYEVFAMQERLDKESKKPQPRSRTSYITIKDKYGISSTKLLSRSGIRHPAADPRRKEMVVDPNIASTALEEVEQIPVDIYEKEVDLNSITTMMQRLAEPAVQPTDVGNLVPTHKRLFIKRSQRCRVCEHNVSKPEFNPASIKFKIQLSAYNHVPDIKVFTCEPLRVGSVSELMLKLSNPTQHLTNIQFLPLGAEVEAIDIKAGGDAPLQNKQSQVVKAPQSADAKITGSLTLPAGSVTLPQRDDAAEYDDSGDAQSVQDDPKVVVWRKGNKAMVKMAVTPAADCAVGDQVVAAFVMRYVYTNTMVTIGTENKEKQRVQLSVPIFVKLGKVVGNG